MINLDFTNLASALRLGAGQTTYFVGESRTAISLAVLVLAACGGGGGHSLPPTYTVGGTVSGLSGTGLVLRNNGGDDLAITGNGSFTFTQPIASGATYSVTVHVEPTGPVQRCVASDGSGRVGANVSTIAVTCATSILNVFAGIVSGDGSGAGAAFSFSGPVGIATDAAGNVYVADSSNDTIVKITAPGMAAVFAGSAGVRGSADGTGTDAAFYAPRRLATDFAGNIYVSDLGNDTIRKITPAGVVTTLAGQVGVYGSADGTGTAALFNFPLGVAADPAGDVFVADEGNNTIRKITPAAVVTTFAGAAGVAGSADGLGPSAQFRGPSGMALKSSGDLYVADSLNFTIRRITAAGSVTTIAGTAGTAGIADGIGQAAQFRDPEGLALDAAGAIYVADYSSSTIRKMTPDGLVTTFAGKAGINGYADGVGAAVRFAGPADVAADNVGNIYVADLGNQNIRKITPAGVVTTFAGPIPNVGSTDATGAAARFSVPHGVASDVAGNIYVGDTGNSTIRKITPAGIVTTFAGTAGVSGHADNIGAAASFDSPWGVAFDAAGNLYVADSAQIGEIRKITPAGVVTTLAVAGKSPHGIAIDTAGNVYVVSTGSCMILAITPTGVVRTLAGTDNSYVIPPAYPGAFPQFVPCQGSADGIGSAALFSSPQGIATDAVGNVYVADTLNNTIRKISKGGVVTTFAGDAAASGSADGTGVAARFSAPVDLAADAAGNLYVADAGNAAVRKITPAGVVSTVVGVPGGVPGQAGFTGGALPGTIAIPQGVAISSTSLYITLYHGVAVVQDVP